MTRIANQGSFVHIKQSSGRVAQIGVTDRNFPTNRFWGGKRPRKFHFGQVEYKMAEADA